jgi:hypothetical protein
MVKGLGWSVASVGNRAHVAKELVLATEAAAQT